MPGSGRPSSTSRVSGIGAHDLGGLAGRREEQLRIDGGDLQRDRLAGRRAAVRLRHLDDDAGDVLRHRADLVHDDAGLAPLLPVDELELDGADRVLGHLVGAALALAGARIDGRRSPACRAAAPRPARRACPSRGWRGCRARAPARGRSRARYWGRTRRRCRSGHRPATTPTSSHDRQRAASPRVVQRDASRCACRGRGPRRARPTSSAAWLGSAEHGAERRREEQRHDERGRQRRDQRQRHVFHELADDAGPEEQRREGGDARRGRGDHRAGHALRRRANRPRAARMPSAMRRSANSETMMASSTSMPTARISENSTTMLTVSPAS